MRILALDSATGSCSSALVADEEVVASRHRTIDRGHAALLPTMVSECLAEAGIAAADLDLVAVTVGPGSFTGIRGALALGLGIAQAAGVPAVAVTVGEALAASLPLLGGRALWVVTHSRRGRLFLERSGEVESLAVEDLPFPAAPVAIAGNAADDVASRLAARGANIMLTDARVPLGRHIASVAARRFRQELPPLPPVPLYIDAPEVRRPQISPQEASSGGVSSGVIAPGAG